MTTQIRHCRCCGAAVEHDGWLAVCDDPECARKGIRDHARKKHLQIFRAGPGCYGVFVCDLDDPDHCTVTPAYFDTEAEAKAFVARVRSGISKGELAALVKAHLFPRERITIEELRRRAQTDE